MYANSLTNNQTQTNTTEYPTRNIDCCEINNFGVTKPFKSVPV